MQLGVRWVETPYQGASLSGVQSFSRRTKNLATRHRDCFTDVRNDGEAQFVIARSEAISFLDCTDSSPSSEMIRMTLSGQAFTEKAEQLPVEDLS